MRYSATAPQTEPISLAAAKEHIKALPGESTEDEAIIAPLISAAREYCENVTGRSLASETITAYPERFETMLFLPRPPVLSITSVKYTDADGDVTTMDANNYAADDERIVFYSIPRFQPALLNPVEITYTAGYSTMPFTIRQAILLLIGHWYVNREAVVIGPLTSVAVQIAVDRLLNQWKVKWF